MALPTKGRVILETTVGDIDIELWAKVCARFLPQGSLVLTLQCLGNAKDMSQFHCFGYGR